MKSFSDSFKEFLDGQAQTAWWFHDNVEPIVDKLIGGVIHVIGSAVRTGVLVGLIVPALFFWLITFDTGERVNLIHALNGQSVAITCIDSSALAKSINGHAPAQAPIKENHLIVSGEEYLSGVKDMLSRIFLIMFCLIFGWAQVRAVYRFFISNSHGALKRGNIIC